MIKVKIHSIVDVITNSSTVIFTYQNSVKEAKALVQAVLDLCGLKEVTPDNVFYYGVFCDNDKYFESGNVPEDCPAIEAEWGTPERKEQQKSQIDWLEALQISIMKDEIPQPEWMTEAETNHSDGWDPNSYLAMIPKDDKYKDLAAKMKTFLSSPSSDGGQDG